MSWKTSATARKGAEVFRISCALAQGVADLFRNSFGPLQAAADLFRNSFAPLQAAADLFRHNSAATEDEARTSPMNPTLAPCDHAACITTFTHSSRWFKNMS